MFILLSACTSSGAWAAAAWHGERDIAQALTEAAFEGMATRHPAVAAAYGAYTVAEIGREAAEERVTDLDREVTDDLLAVDADAAALRALAREGRRPARDWLTCQSDPPPCEVANRLRTRMETMPGGTGRFVARALLDRRTLWVAARNYAEDGIFDQLGGSAARMFGIRRATPVVYVSLRGVRSPFARAQWKAIRHVARRMDRLSERVFEVLAGEFFRSFYRQVMDSRLAGAVEYFQRLSAEATERRANDASFRLQLVEAAPIFAPAAALAVASPAMAPAPALVLRRAEDPVIDRASVQSQMVQHYEVPVSDATVRGQDSGWHGVEDRSANIPDVQLPSSSIDWDGSGFR